MSSITRGSAFLRPLREALLRDPSVIAIKCVSPCTCNGKLSRSPFGYWGWMNSWHGQAPIVMSPFCLIRVKKFQWEEDSPSCGVLDGLIQSLLAVNNMNYALSSNLPLRQPFKTSLKEIMLNLCQSGWFAEWYLKLWNRIQSCQSNHNITTMYSNPAHNNCLAVFSFRS